MPNDQARPAYRGQPAPGQDLDPNNLPSAHQAPQNDTGKAGERKRGAETSRQEGAQGRVGRMPDDQVGDGSIDAGDPKMDAQKY